MTRIALCVTLAALATTAGRAQDSSIEEAKAHAARAKVHYDLGEYQQAAEEYILVYRIRPLPALLYNIAQSYRQAGQYDKAKQFYKSYLRETQDPKNREVIEKAIKEIDELLAKEKKAKDGPPQGVAQERGLVPPATAAVTPPSLPSTPPPAGSQPSAATSAPAAQQPAVAKEAAKAPGTQVAVATSRTAPTSATSTTGPPAVEQGTPFYKTWWFWTAAGVVAVGAGTAVALSAGGSASAPSTHLGTTPVF